MPAIFFFWSIAFKSINVFSFFAKYCMFMHAEFETGSYIIPTSLENLQNGTNAAEFHLSDW